MLAVHPNIRFSGYYSRQELVRNEDVVPAFGYLYHHQAATDKRALQDFNRADPGQPFIKKATPNLPLSRFTYDTYFATGPGMSGLFRPFRSDVSMLHDPEVVNPHTQLDAGVEIGLGAAFHMGGELKFTTVKSRSGDWSGGNQLASALNIITQTPGVDYEPHYFKATGESSVEPDQDFYEHFGNDQTVEVVLGKGILAKAKNQFRDVQDNRYSAPSYHRTQRAKRQRVFSYLTAEEAQFLALDKDIHSYTDDFTSPSDSIDRVSPQRKAHHLSEVKVLKPDGSRYVYGIPAYNNLQREVSFNVAGRTHDCETGLVSYESSGAQPDNSIHNERGIDHYFNAVELPSYAHSYLLTAVLSPDYIDRTDNGCTEDDYGTWHKLNYTRLYSDFRWRGPIQADSASYNEGFKTDRNDDKGSYVYGEKEIWHIQSIESKHQVALFEFSDRDDALGVNTENGGGLDQNKRLKKLDKITLYAKKDLAENGTEDAVPLKTVHFKYDYSLCPGVPNSTTGEGKLTLKQLFFTYGSSEKARFSPYTFTYADPDHDGTIDAPYNPPYHLKGVERWGNFQPNTSSCAAGQLPNWEYPYTDQQVIPSSDTEYYDPTDPQQRYADVYAQAWHLTSIKTPSGSEIRIDYEADDYSYVQDKKAMQMVKIRGVGVDDNIQLMDDELYRKQAPLGQFENRNVLFVDLPTPVNSALDFRQKYLAGIEKLYFNFSMNATPIEVFQREYERVAGYVEIENSGIINNQIAWIKVKESGVKDNDQGVQVPAISKAAWNFMKMNLPERIYPGSDPQGTGESAIMGLLGPVMDAASMLFGFYKIMRLRGFGRWVEPQKSWIRLNNPDSFKHGGGVRVKRIELLDRWDEMTNGEPDASYGQEYEYTTTDGNQNPISSGVASYEPLLGGDEIPHRLPLEYRHKKLLFPDDLYYLEHPFGESLFPSPRITYSKVATRDLQHPDITRNRTGYSIHEFYTTRDFPTRVEALDLQPRLHNPLPVLNFFNITNINLLTTGQGYKVKRMHMDGVPKAQWIYAANGKKISGIEYFYRTKPALTPGGETPALELDNTNIQVIYPDNSVGQATIGQEIEMYVDSREQQTTSQGNTTKGNLDTFLALILPIPLPTLYPGILKEKRRFRSIVNTKVEDAYGIPDRTIVHSDGASITTRNLAFDAETAQVLLTETKNEYKDPVYNFNYPAHWTYEGMGPAYQNLGLEWKGNVLLNQINQASAFFYPGDEVLLDAAGTLSRAWVLKVIGGNEVRLIDQAGSPVSNGPYNRIKIIRSGKKNLLQASVGAVSSKTAPATQNGDLVFDAVLNASASEFSDQWQTFCNCLPPNTNFNPFITGVSGNWALQRSYTYLTNRSTNNPTPLMSTDIRREGTFTQFSPFWKWNGDTWIAEEDQWTWVQEVTLRPPMEFELENKDALNRYASSLYGYGGRLPIAITSNARHHQIANANFETAADHCLDHLTFSTQQNSAVPPTLSPAHAHSGYQSAIIPKQGSLFAKQTVIDTRCTDPIQDPSTLDLNCDCVGTFTPTSGKKYLVSMWVKSGKYLNANEIIHDHSEISLITSLDSSALAISNLQKSKIMDGWQKITAEVDLQHTGDLTLEIRNASSDHFAYLDDFRFHPFESNMDTYVYDPNHQRLVAIGDENNFFNFYQYNSEGRLTGVKRENERGIQSVQSVEYHSARD